MPLNKGDGLVGHVGFEVIALGWRFRSIDRRRVFPKGRVPLAHAGAEEAVEIFRTHTARSAVERSGGVDFVHGCKMGLPNPRGAITIQPQGFEHCRGVALNVGVVSRVMRGLRAYGTLGPKTSGRIARP